MGTLNTERFLPWIFKFQRKATVWCEFSNPVLLKTHLSQWSAPWLRSRRASTWQRRCNCWTGARRSAPGRCGRWACRPRASGPLLPASTSRTAWGSLQPRRWCWCSLLAWFHCRQGGWRSEGEPAVLEQTRRKDMRKYYTFLIHSTEWENIWHFTDFKLNGKHTEPHRYMLNKNV